MAGPTQGQATTPGAKKTSELVKVFVGQDTSMTEPEFTAIAAAEDIAEKSFSTFEVNGTNIAVCRLQDVYFAIENRCSHALSTFDNGRLRGYRIMCPLHGATFDVRNGACTGAPASRPIRTFPLRVVGGMIEVNLSG